MLYVSIIIGYLFSIIVWLQDTILISLSISASLSLRLSLSLSLTPSLSHSLSLSLSLSLLLSFLIFSYIDFFLLPLHSSFRCADSHSFPLHCSFHRVCCGYQWSECTIRTTGERTKRE